MKKLIMIGVHKDSIGDSSKKIPASIFKIYEVNGENCFGDKYIGCAEQVYARPNKAIDYNKINVNDFKGKNGITEEFYTQNSMDEFLQMIVEDGYVLLEA